MTINKYVFCLVRDNFEVGVRFTGYHRKETVKDFQELSNPIVKAVLQYLDYRDHVEIVTMSDVRTNCGLGTSSAFTVGLIHALKSHRNQKCDQLQLAKDAVVVEREILKESGGIQDQYATALGGVISMNIDARGNVDPMRFFMSERNRELFISRCFLYDTKTERFSSDVQMATIRNIMHDEDNFEALRELMGIGHEIESALKNGDISLMGRMMHSHWQLKKRYSHNEAWGKYDGTYRKAIMNGALGGKLVGAGGGGYFLFVLSETVDPVSFNSAMLKEGLNRLEFDFEDNGSSVLFKG